MTPFKKYGLLENGSIQRLWYDDEEPRHIENIEGYDYLLYDKIELNENGTLKRIGLHIGKIIAQADTIEELEAIKNEI